LKAEERFRALFENTSEVIILVEPGYRVCDVSPSVTNVLGHLPEEVRGKSLRQLKLFPPKAAEKAFQDIDDILSGERLSSTSYTLIARDGTEIFCEVKGTPVRGEEDATMALLVVKDVSERNRLEKKVLEVSEREKKNLARDLHDSLSQELTAIGFMLKIVERKLPEKSLDLTEEIKTIEKQVAESARQVCTISQDLDPVELETQNLTAALIELAARAEQRYGISCCVRPAEPVRSKPLYLPSQLYRIVQETIRHFVFDRMAKKVLIELDLSLDPLQLRIESDAKAVSSVSEDHKAAWQGMTRLRAKWIGAVIESDGEAPQALLLRCPLPLRGENEEEGLS